MFSHHDDNFLEDTDLLLPQMNASLVDSNLLNVVPSHHQQQHQTLTHFNSSSFLVDLSPKTPVFANDFGRMIKREEEDMASILDDDESLMTDLNTPSSATFMKQSSPIANMDLNLAMAQQQNIYAALQLNAQLNAALAQQQQANMFQMQMSGSPPSGLAMAGTNAAVQQQIQQQLLQQQLQYIANKQAVNSLSPMQTLHQHQLMSHGNQASPLNGNVESPAAQQTLAQSASTTSSPSPPPAAQLKKDRLSFDLCDELGNIAITVDVCCETSKFRDLRITREQYNEANRNEEKVTYVLKERDIRFVQKDFSNSTAIVTMHNPAFTHAKIHIELIYVSKTPHPRKEIWEVKNGQFMFKTTMSSKCHPVAMLCKNELGQVIAKTEPFLMFREIRKTRYLPFIQGTVTATTSTGGSASSPDSSSNSEPEPSEHSDKKRPKKASSTPGTKGVSSKIEKTSSSADATLERKTKKQLVEFIKRLQDEVEMLRAHNKMMSMNFEQFQKTIKLMGVSEQLNEPDERIGKGSVNPGKKAAYYTNLQNVGVRLQIQVQNKTDSAAMGNTQVEDFVPRVLADEEYEVVISNTKFDYIDLEIVHYNCTFDRSILPLGVSSEGKPTSVVRIEKDQSMSFVYQFSNPSTSPIMLQFFEVCFATPPAANTTERKVTKQRFPYFVETL